MVILNGLKYACETCIKGHRSSACSHTERTLLEIKKKGRPITQCEHCRHLRKTRQVHVKCLCGSRPNGSDKNGARARLKIPASATIRIDPNDPTHATITAGPGLLAPQTLTSASTAAKIKPKTKPKDAKSAETKSGNNTRPSSPSFPTFASAASASQPLPSAAPTSSRNNNNHRPRHKGAPASTTTSRGSCSPSNENEDKYAAASLLSDLSRAAIRRACAVTSATNTYHHRLQPFYNHNPNLGGTSYTWHGQQSGVNLESSGCGSGAPHCACSGCSSSTGPSPGMVLVSGGENCPYYTRTTCTACNGYGFTSHVSGAFIVPSHQPGPHGHWRQQPASSSTVMSAAHPVPAPAAAAVPSSASVPGQMDIDKSTATTESVPHQCSHDGEELRVSERNGFAVSGERKGCSGCMDALRHSPYPLDDHDEAASASSASASSPALSVEDHDPNSGGSKGGSFYSPVVDVKAKDRPAPLPMAMHCSLTATAPVQMHPIKLPKLIV